MTNQVGKVRRETINACMTCPLCSKLLKEATTISECLHTFCRKCIHEKLTEEEQDCCPVCNLDLGCVPVEKLRPDHNVQDVISKIFPSKRQEVKAPDSLPPTPLPTRRKERSLSSLVVSTPRVSTQTGLRQGRRTKAVARKAGYLRGSKVSVEESVKKEEVSAEGCPNSPSSREPVNKIAQYRRQHPSNANTSDLLNSDKDLKDGAEPFSEKTDLWKPLNCLVEVANRTKLFKHPAARSEPPHVSSNESPACKAKVREYVSKRAYDVKNGTSTSELVKPKTVQRMRRKRTPASEELDKTVTTKEFADTSGPKQGRTCPIWFTLLASDDQGEDAPLPQISKCYLKIKDSNIPVSFVQKYVANKLDLKSEAEVEIKCQGQSVVPSLHLNDLVDLWLQTTSIPQKLQASMGFSAKDVMLVLTYQRKSRATEAH